MIHRQKAAEGHLAAFFFTEENIQTLLMLSVHSSFCLECRHDNWGSNSHLVAELLASVKIKSSTLRMDGSAELSEESLSP